jgi:hypothetical protein
MASPKWSFRIGRQASVNRLFQRLSRLRVLAKHSEPTRGYRRYTHREVAAPALRNILNASSNWALGPRIPR